MASECRFSLSRASAADLAELARVQYRSFGPFMREIFMGCKSEADLPLITQKYASELAEDPHDLWIKVVDTASGNIVAGSNWKVYPNAAPDSSDDKLTEWLDGETRETAIKVLRKVTKVRKIANKEGGYIRQ